MTITPTPGRAPCRQRPRWLLRACQIRDVTEPLARSAAQLRTATGRAGTISSTDATLAAYAATRPDPIIVTGDPADLTALAAHASRGITVRAV